MGGARAGAVPAAVFADPHGGRAGGAGWGASGRGAATIHFPVALAVSNVSGFSGLAG